jgi:type VI secretion system Hcp family effector
MGPLSPDHVVRLQHTIGNQAVQRLILQRAPKDDKSKVADSAPSVMGTITLERQGKIKGGSRKAGHEDKVEILSISSESRQVRRGGREDRDTEERVTITITRFVDNASGAFARAYTEGEAVSAAAFDLVRSGSDGNLETFHTLEFSEGLISGISTSSSEGRGIETISFEFVKRSKE